MHLDDGIDDVVGEATTVVLVVLLVVVVMVMLVARGGASFFADRRVTELLRALCFFIILR